MSAGWYVGRVGGLAVVLGVGAAVFGGTAAAWADEDGGNRAAEVAKAGPRTDAGPAVAKRAVARPDSAKRASVSAAGVSARVRSSLVDPSPPAPIAAALDTAVLSAARRELQPAAATPAVSGAVLPAAAQSTALVMGPSGVPIPKEDYVQTVMDFYVTPNSPEGTTAQVVFTPEGLYPITGVKSLPLNTSVDQGIDILTRTMAGVPSGTPTTVFGYSQSAIIGGLLQEDYNGYRVPPVLQDSTQFVFVGNELNPNGGFLSRFPDLNLPSLGMPFYGATPEDAYPTFNYTLEYDGFADFPRYPLNFLSVLNAAMGIGFVHVKYADPRYLTITEVTPISRGGTAIELPTTSPTQNYYFIRTENLPLLEPLRWVPVIGNPLADLIQPVLKVIVDLGYGDPAHGFTSATQPYANILTPFGLFPELNPLEVLTRLAAGVVQGINDFVGAFGPGGSVIKEISALRIPSFTLPDIALPTPDGIIAAIQSLVTAVSQHISSSAATLYAALLPTADIVNSFVSVLPAYNVNLFLGGIQQVLHGDIIGGVLNAALLPIAADVGLVTLASLVGVGVWAQSIATVLNVAIPT